MSEKQKNPAEFGYLGNETITITAREFATLRGAVDHFLDKETTKAFPEKYKYINSENGNEIKKVTDKNRPVARKVVDVEKTMQSEPVISRTGEGLELLKVKFMLEGIHTANIESGVAKHYTELEQILKGGGMAATEPTQEAAPGVETNEGMTQAPADENEA